MAALDDTRAQLQMRRNVMQQGRTRRLRKRPPKQLLPRGERLFYQKALRDIQREIEAIITREILDRLDEFVISAGIDRPEGATRQDAPADQVARAAAAAQTAVSQLVTEQALLTTTQQVAERISRHGRRQLGKQLESVLGVDVIVSEPFIASQVTAFVKDNTRLITNFANDQVAKVESIVLRGVRTGKRVEVIRKEIQARLGVSRKRANLIARDQTNKLNGELNQLRQTSLGIKSYIWRTVGDDSVREEHEARDGQTFQWSGPPSDGHPGEPINCRCTAEPVLDDLVA